MDYQNQPHLRSGAGDAFAKVSDSCTTRYATHLRSGAGDAFAKAFEIVATPAVFGCLGWFADSRFGVFPALTLVSVVVVFGYQLWRFSHDYSAAMDAALDRRRAAYAQPSGVGGAAISSPARRYAARSGMSDSIRERRCGTEDGHEVCKCP